MVEGPKRMRSPRALTDFRVQVRCTAGQFNGSGRDLSTGGMRIRGPFHASHGERIWVTLGLPTPRPVSLMAEVRWAKQEDPDNYVLGIRFLHTAETQKMMQLLLQEVQSGKLGVLRSAANTRRIPKV